jgi:hypothetical protein
MLMLAPLLRSSDFSGCNRTGVIPNEVKNLDRSGAFKARSFGFASG